MQALMGLGFLPARAALRWKSCLGNGEAWIFAKGSDQVGDGHRRHACMAFGRWVFD